MNDELNPQIAVAFERACGNLGGIKPEIRLMRLVKVDNTKDMVAICVARLTQENETIKVAIAGQFQTKSGFISKVGCSIEKSVSELTTGFKGISLDDVLQKEIDDAMTKLFAQGYSDWQAHEMSMGMKKALLQGVTMDAEKMKKDFKLPQMHIGMDLAKEGADKTVIQQPAAFQPIEQLTDREVKEEIEYHRKRHNLVGGIGSCGTQDQTPEERRRGDLSALRALDRHLTRPTIHTLEKALATHP